MNQATSFESVPMFLNAAAVLLPHLWHAASEGLRRAAQHGADSRQHHPDADRLLAVHAV
jgi:hypothetical protein